MIDDLNKMSNKMINNNTSTEDEKESPEDALHANDDLLDSENTASAVQKYFNLKIKTNES